MAALRRPRGVLFDLGNTILREGGFDARAGHRRLFELAGVEPSESALDAYGARAAALAKDIQSRRIGAAIEFGTSRMTRVLAAQFGHVYRESDDALELAFWRASITMSPEPGVAAALESVRTRGLPLGVVSNTAFSGHVLRDELARHGLLDPFAFVIASNDYGFRKPHPALFEVAAARLGLPPAEIWFVGDSLEFDVRGARAAGMTAIWYAAGAGARVPDEATAVVRDWSELGDLLPPPG